MASRMDERGYVENGNPRQREPYAAQDNAEELRRASGRNRRRDEREFERDEIEDERRFNERPGQGDRRQPLPLTLSDAFVTAFERGAQVLGENLRIYQDETVRFVTERLEQDTQMLEQLGKSRSMFDLFTVQQKWLSAATRAYSEEFMRLSKLTGDATQRSAQETRTAINETRRAGHDVQ